MLSIRFSKRRIKLASITLAVLVLNVIFVVNTNAQYSNIYAELSYGKQQVEDFEFFLGFSDFSNQSSEENVVGIAFGRKFNDNVSAEISYQKFDNFESEITSFFPVLVFDSMGNVISTMPSVPDFSEFEIASISVSVIGSYRLGSRVNIFAKGGLSQGNITAKFFDNNISRQSRGSESGSGLQLGLGFVFNVTRSFALEFEYQVTDFGNNLFVDNVKISTSTVALRYNF